jgi:TolA-binding protein
MSLQIQPKPEEQQPSADLTLSVLTWLEENKKTLAIGFAVVSAVAVTLIIQKNLHASAEAEANQALLATLSAAGKNGGPTAADLSKVASQHSGTAAAERSEFLAATKLFEDGKYAEAQKALEAFNQAHADSLLGGAATYGVASALDAQNKTAEAIAAYARFISGFAADPLVAQARLSKALIHESQKQYSEAIALYDEVAKDTTSMAAQEASARKAALIQAHPELTPALTNAPAVKPAVKPVP